MRYYNGVYRTNYIRGRGHCSTVLRKQEGEGILQDLIYEGVALARKYITPDNLKRAGQKVLSILREEGEEFIRDKATDLVDKGTAKLKDIATDVIAGKSLKDIGQATKKDFKDTIQQARKKAPSEFKKVVDRAEAKVVESFLDPEFFQPKEPELSDVIGGAMMKHHKSKKGRKKGGSIKKV